MVAGEGRIDDRRASGRMEREFFEEAEADWAVRRVARSTVLEEGTELYQAQVQVLEMRPRSATGGSAAGALERGEEFDFDLSEVERGEEVDLSEVERALAQRGSG